MKIFPTLMVVSLLALKDINFGVKPSKIRCHIWSAQNIDQLISTQNSYKQAFFQMGCVHSVDTRHGPPGPTPEPLQPTPPLTASAPTPRTRINLQTLTCRKEVQVLKNFIYEIKQPLSHPPNKAKTRHTSASVMLGNQTVDPSSIVILLQSKTPQNKRLSHEQKQAETTDNHLYDNRIQEDLSDAVGLISLQFYQQICEGCFAKLHKFTPKGEDRRRQCCYCSGFGVTSRWFPPDSQPKCQKPMCFKRGWDKVRSLLLCESCRGSGHL